MERPPKLIYIEEGHGYCEVPDDYDDSALEGSDVVCAHHVATRIIVDLEQQLADSNLAFDHANSVVGKLEQQLAEARKAAEGDALEIKLLWSELTNAVGVERIYALKEAVWLAQKGKP